MLNYAEALNEVQGPSTEVYNMLDQIRRRSGITGSVANRSDLTSSKEAMRNFIHKERTVELAFEEHRAWDVRRWSVAVEALSRPIYGIDVATNGAISRKTAQGRVFENKMYLYPIPEGEVWKTNIENNPDWK
ncbi:RagB/SusD family nutrient uptake outer membrane protein [Bacteroides graminisolvens]|nr:RagB/SusD family nutrient uptake outer membrane protein [Bacteroides graminisolvens]